MGGTANLTLPYYTVSRSSFEVYLFYQVNCKMFHSLKALEASALFFDILNDYVLM